MKKSKDNWLDFRGWQVEQELKQQQLEEWSKNYIAGIDPYSAIMDEDFRNELNENEKLWLTITKKQ